MNTSNVISMRSAWVLRALPEDLLLDGVWAQVGDGELALTAWLGDHEYRPICDFCCEADSGITAVFATDTTDERPGMVTMCDPCRRRGAA